MELLNKPPFSHKKFSDSMKIVLDNSSLFLYNKRVSELYGSVDAGFRYIHEESPSITGWDSC